MDYTSYKCTTNQFHNKCRHRKPSMHKNKLISDYHTLKPSNLIKKREDYYVRYELSVICKNDIVLSKMPHL